MGELKPHLSLWKKRLGVVPDEVWLRTDLQTLVLADNELTEVSDRIGELSQLRMLDLGHNRLSKLPISLGHLEGLSDFLYLHHNQLTQLPDSLSCLQRLRYLNISENAFEVFPEVVTTMRGLIELRVTDNRLTEASGVDLAADEPARTAPAQQSTGDAAALHPCDARATPD